MANSKRSKWLRILLWTLAVLILLPTLLYVVLLLCNLRDDPLSPEVEKLLAAQPAAIAPEKNGYFAWIGILGPESETPHAWGRRWFEQALIDDKEIRAGAKFRAPMTGLRKEPGLSALPCLPVDSCLEQIAAKPAVARTALNQGRVTLAHGDTVLFYPAYQQILRPDFTATSNFPVYANNWSTLSAIRFALGVAEGKHAVALTQLGREIAFNTRQLEGSSFLIDKMVGITHLRSRYSLLGQYMQRYPAGARQHKAAIAGMLSPLPPAAISMRSALQGEQRFVVNLFQDLSKEARWAALADENQHPQPSGATVADKLAGPLFLQNATINGSAAMFHTWLRVDELEGAAYRQALADARNTHVPGILGLPFSLRNPIGHILANVGGPDWSGYFARRDDILAWRELLLFQLELAVRGIETPERLTQAVKDNEAALTHRYTGELPSWDAEYKQLSYTPAHPGNKNHIVSIRR